VPRLVASLGLGATLLAAASTANATASAGAEGVRWRSEHVAFTVDPSLDEAGPAALSAVHAATTSWQSVGADTPAISVHAGEASALGFVLGGKNQSTVRLASDGEPLAKGALAITVVTYDAKSRTILDADVVLNGLYRFSDGSPGAKQGKKKLFDLQAVLTHELGHAHGLGDDHEHELAVMYEKTLPEDLGKRALSAEDEAALLGLYGQDVDSSEANTSASCASGAARPSAWSGAGVILALAALARRRRNTGRVAALGLGVALVAAPASASGPIDFSAPSAVAVATVAGLTSRWQDGLIVSELALADVSCAGDCEALAEPVLVPGGRIGDVAQVVTHVDLPEPGARVVLEVIEGRSGLGRHRVTLSGKNVGRSER